MIASYCRRYLKSLDALRQLKPQADLDCKLRLRDFKLNYENLVKNKKKDILAISVPEITYAQKERAALILQEMNNMGPLELRTLEFVLNDKRKRRVINVAEVKGDDSAIQKTTQYYWPPVHPLNLEFQQETGQRGVIGLHGFPKKFMDMMASGEIFSALESVTVATGTQAEVVKEVKKEEKTIFNVVLKGFTADSKIKVIKEVKTILNLGLKEAKDQVEACQTTPIVLYKSVSKETHQEILDKLKSLGADVEFQ
jgi:ribosomal protein L7/L12